LSTRLAGSLQQEVRLTARVDPAIMGGLVVQLGDRLVDASIRSRLQQLRRRLALS
ncbi:MAG: F0F1 ATP synthase subunit delta, partial [Candidatus Dormibacteraceae bacterium]